MLWVRASEGSKVGVEEGECDRVLCRGKGLGVRVVAVLCVADDLCIA